MAALYGNACTWLLDAMGVTLATDGAVVVRGAVLAVAAGVRVVVCWDAGHSGSGVLVQAASASAQLAMNQRDAWLVMA